jgi:hypothetical protein
LTRRKRCVYSKGVDSGAIEKIERFGEEISVEAQTLRDYRRVAAAWPNAERSAFASWSVHQILASKPDRFDLIKRLPVDKKTGRIRTVEAWRAARRRR